MGFALLVFLLLLALTLVLLRENALRHGNPDAKDLTCRWGFHPYEYRPGLEQDFYFCPKCQWEEPVTHDLSI